MNRSYRDWFWASFLMLALLASGCDESSSDSADDTQGGGGDQATYSVTTQAGSGGSLSPSSLSVTPGETALFTVITESGYRIEQVEGCNGSLNGDRYTTGPISADCTVSASFLEDNLPVLRVGDASVSEGDSGTVVLNFVVSLSEAADGDVSVDYATQDVTASAGRDYAATSGTLTIPAPSTSGEITVSVMGDSDYEPTETFTLSLSNVSANALLVTATAVGTINNDDGSDGVSYSVTTYADSGGSLSPTSQSVAPGESAQFTVSVEDGYRIDQVEGCNGSLNGDLYTTGPISADCTVGASFQEDNLPGLSVGDASVSEGDSGTVMLNFVVSLSEAADGDVSVDYATQDETASAGSDYTATSGILIIPATETSGEIVVSVNGDRDYEPTETFTLSLSNVSANAVLETATAVGTITNDDSGGTLGNGESAATAIYTAHVTHAEAQPISSGIIGDAEERKRWSSEVPLSAGYNEFWVAAYVAEGEGSGTREDPWSLYSLLEGLSYQGGPIPDNSIVWLEGGDYISPKSNLADRQATIDGANIPLWPIRRLNGDVVNNRGIHIRPVEGAQVRIDGGVKFDDAWAANGVWFWDAEMTSLASAHTEGAYIFPEDDYRPQPDYFIPVGEGYGGTVEFYHDVKQWLVDNNSFERSTASIHGGDRHAMINMIVTRSSGGINSWGSAENALIYGNVVNDVGYLAEDRPHGPGFYAQNLTDTPRHYDENIVAGSFSNPFQIYSRTQGGAALGSMYGKGNIVFGGRIIGDDVNQSGPRVDVLFGDDEGINQHFTENYLYAVSMRTGAFDAADNEFANNHVIYSRTTECVACSESSNYVEAHLSKSAVYIRPNAYDPRRANMVVMNADRDPTIAINLGTWASSGDHILVYNAANLTADAVPIAQGIYDGSYFNLSMTGYTNEAWEYYVPVSWALEENPKDTAEGDYQTVEREFWAFVLIKNP
ncbi:MAG: Calx-beta domain-containing protein [Candidatus Thiodiazotropha sp.]